MQQRNASATYLTCPPSFDSVLCWQETPAGTTAIQPCFAEFKGIHYNTTGKYEPNYYINKKKKQKKIIIIIESSFEACELGTTVPPYFLLNAFLMLNVTNYR